MRHFPYLETKRDLIIQGTAAFSEKFRVRCVDAGTRTFEREAWASSQPS